MMPIDFNQLRVAMVDDQIAGRGVRDPKVLEVMRVVPREIFVPEPLREFAYEDSALQVDAEQTIPQPYLVAVMTEALSIGIRANVLEIGTGTGYTTAVLSRLARSVCTVETSAATAARAANALLALGCTNVHFLHGDESHRFAQHAPFDAIMVNAPGPHVPQALGQQLAIGGRLVMSVGIDPAVRELVRVTRVSESEFRTEDLADIRVAVSAAGSLRISTRRNRGGARGSPDMRLAKAVAAGCERFDTVDSVELGPLLERIGNARVVLMGEATHGTSEFYRMRERISRELIVRKNFNFIAIEGDWPDAARIDRYVRHGRHRPARWTAFARFPAWMWRNQEVRGFVDWLREHNAGLGTAERVAFHGLDLYSLYNSIHSVVGYLEEIDPPTAGIARQRYGCLTPWQSDPASYGYAALNARYRSCEQEVVSMLGDLLHRQPIYTGHDGERFLDAVQNARLVADAERYYRTMYYGSRASWNLRDSHMFETLEDLLSFHGPASKAIVWAHNSHVGDARATEMSRRGEHNIGQLCRQAFGSAACLIGFGTDSGTVAAASDWDGPMEVKTIRPSVAGSYERLCHEAEVANFILPLRGPASAALLDSLSQPRLERAIGVLYRPQTELQSHYFQAVLPRQFDEYIWFDQTRAVKPLDTETIEGLPETYPFGL
ncbi:protein-L-isoaspartate O-methyltransferase [Variovorax soli]|uniref:Protein-L-isoaspartate O-methyltransferase n=1 Tax=Variovorax soli TaxID=376815 RepID=A0ABU1NKV7_9BURK|nr:protein-L-isoaspartate O-methyltransferase [Variovorax soli]MDR6539108.1 protein-L-isoaspartate(D-aspartate) O-methyltransferase [Variovorax soli]